MAERILIGSLRDQDRGLDLPFFSADVDHAGFDVEIFDRQTADTVDAGQLDDRFIRVQCGSRIGRSHAVAGVPADRPDVADLR